MNDPLREALVELATEAQAKGIRLVVGGGYGLVLKTELVEASGQPTVLGAPRVARATADLDFFLPVEVISSAEKSRQFREILDRLGYEPVETAKYFQFKRGVDYGGRRRSIKIDLLAPPVEGAVTDSVRIRPRDYRGLHARITPEAETVHWSTTRMQLGGTSVELPHPYSVLLLKLHALRDRIMDGEAQLGANHAEDLFNTVALLTESEFEEIERFRGNADAESSARLIMNELFEDATSLGSIRVREAVSPTDEDFGRFLDVLRRILVDADPGPQPLQS